MRDSKKIINGAINWVNHPLVHAILNPCIALLPHNRVVWEFTKDDPEHLKRTQDFRREVDKRFSFGGARSDREDAAIPIAWEDRLEAGFSEDELSELAELASGGPSKETLVRAAKILRERYLAEREARKAEATS